MTAASAVNLQISRPEDAVPTYETAYAAGAGAAAAHTAAAAAEIDAVQSSFWSMYSNPKAASGSGSPRGCHAARPLPTTTIAMSPPRLPLLPLSRNCRRRRRPQGGLTPAYGQVGDLAAAVVAGAAAGGGARAPAGAATATAAMMTASSHSATSIPHAGQVGELEPP